MNGSGGSNLADCDLVMKGGITSGVVYPSAIGKLAGRYRFRCIGGTSAGAIAAAGAAAAEHGRQTGGGGFDALMAMSGELGKKGFLLELLRPYSETAPLLNGLIALQTSEQAAEIGRLHRDKAPIQRVVRSALSCLADVLRRHDARAFGAGEEAWGRRGRGLGLKVFGGLGLVVAAGAALGAVAGDATSWGRVLLAALAIVAVALALGAYLGTRLGRLVGGPLESLRGMGKLLTEDLPRAHGYGLVGGFGDGQSDGGSGDRATTLTDWLYTHYNRLAGLEEGGRPLTFGDLRAQGITLRLVTTNLSHGQPYELPLDKQRFLVDLRDMQRLFPKPVTDHLAAHAAPSRSFQVPEDGPFRFLPSADDLPVVVAVRLSLSFPILLSAVRLWTIRGDVRGSRTDPPRLDESLLQPNWFSDGGICSNFPIHFFDRWLPGRPTFGINLTTLTETTEAAASAQASATAPPLTLSASVEEDADLSDADPSDENAPTAEQVDAAERGPVHDVAMTERAALSAQPEERVRIRAANDPRAIWPEWQPVQGLLPFASAIISTMQNYRDNLQSRLPGFRERIVQIRLRRDEGGLNLAMDPDTIAQMQRFGDESGKKLLEEFELRHHQWVRLRTLMEQVEEQLEAARGALAPAEIASLLEDQLRAIEEGNPFPYRKDRDWCARAGSKIGLLGTVADRWQSEPDLFHLSDADPRPELRVTPRF